MKNKEINEELMIRLDEQIRGFIPYSSPCTCCEHDPIWVADGVGDKLNELFLMIRIIGDLLEERN